MLSRWTIPVDARRRSTCSLRICPPPALPVLDPRPRASSRTADYLGASFSRITPALPSQSQDDRTALIDGRPDRLARPCLTGIYKRPGVGIGRLASDPQLDRFIHHPSPE
jgi:hypothetical protein